jgi:hypothetical protein
MRSPITARTKALAPMLLIVAAPSCHPPPSAPAEDPPEVVVGERLFLETRFAQLYASSASALPL